MARLTMLDVGHGNCAVIQSDNCVIVIDAGLGSTLLEFVKQESITQIDRILISHSDSDHIAGVIGILSQKDIHVSEIHLNSDADKESDLWLALRVALADAELRRNVHVYVGLTSRTKIDCCQPDVTIDVVAPAPAVAASGVGGLDLGGRRLTANSLSAVIKVCGPQYPVALLAGDIDDVGLENMLSYASDIKAPLLIFPHHGGRPGDGDPFDFADKLAGAVSPSLVVFSIGRGRHGTPLPEIVKGIRSGSTGCRIACTQLSKRCSSVVPGHEPTHLSVAPAKGKGARACCAGTIHIDFDYDPARISPDLDAHGDFLRDYVPGAICLTL